MRASATIIILPIVSRERVTEDARFSVSLSRRDWGRLTRRATEWKMTPQEAAGHLIAMVLDPKRRIP